MINKKYQNAYAEVLYYLKGIRQNDIIKIPRGLISHFEKFKNPEYICDFDYTKPLKELKLLDETKGLIGMICLNYWCDSTEKKQQLLNTMKDNELKHQEKLKKLYDSNNIFKENDNRKNIYHQEKSLIEVKEKNFITKLLDKIKRIFK